jgi:hypothetical protein
MCHAPSLCQKLATCTWLDKLPGQACVLSLAGLYLLIPSIVSSMQVDLPMVVFAHSCVNFLMPTLLLLTKLLATYTVT